jgi:hypothetical protein
VNIFEDMIHHHHHDQAVPATHENPVTTPQQPAHVVDSLHAITAELASNGFIARLADSGLGKALTDGQAAAVAALVATIEREQAQQQRNAAIVATIWSRLQQSDEALSAGWLRSLITGQPGDAQQQAG